MSENYTKNDLSQEDQDRKNSPKRALVTNEPQLSSKILQIQKTQNRRISYFFTFPGSESNQTH